MNQLLQVKGDKWKDLRSTFTPIFTTGKMKLMTKMINVLCRDMNKKLETAADKNEEVDFKTHFGNYSMGVIASCAFGVDADTFGDKESPFVAAANGIFTNDALRLAKIMLASAIPRFSKLLGALGISMQQEKVVKNAVR